MLIRLLQNIITSNHNSGITFARNYATSSAGGFYSTSTNDVVRNSIFWGNTAGSNAQINNGWPTTTYTDIQGDCASCVDKTGNINATPQFISLVPVVSSTPTTAANYHLCYANGVADAPTVDIDGDTWLINITGIGDENENYDMGADEYKP